MPRSFWVETLGCPKNQVDSDQLTATMLADGLVPAGDADDADLVVVNTCAFVADAREESVATVLDLDERRRDGSELVVTGCMAERYGDELAQALPEVDSVAGFGAPLGVTAPVQLLDRPGRRGASLTASGERVPRLDLLNLPRPASTRPWAYVKVAEGCDKRCGFCAIPSFRGPQVSRSIESIVAEVDQLDVREVVLIAQDLAAYGADRTDPAGPGQRRIVELVRAVSERVERVRLLYLYPSELTDELIELIAGGPVPYFDLSLQHVSGPLVRRMRRWGDGERYLERIRAIRRLRPDAAFRSNFIVGYPGETEEDHDALLRFVEEARVEWCGLFAYSAEDGTHAAGLDGVVPEGLVEQRLAELRELADRVSAEVRDTLIGTEADVLVDEAGAARSHREAPEIDGIVEVPESLPVGEIHRVRIVDARGPDLVGEPTVAAGVGDG